MEVSVGVNHCGLGHDNILPQDHPENTFGNTG